ncbi:MAG TPA: ribulose-phosphate 3-epimerase [Peptococcaceae bacterium]|nr:ribulose-phosphate 3-epimerase [Peptococcaceae bacterium]
MALIAPSLLAADFGRLREEVASVEAAGADWIHLDIMDGHFVPNLTIGPEVVAALRPYTQLPFDVHLMLEKPEDFIIPFARAGADWISVHAEACTHLHRVINQIREAGCRPAVALNPATSLRALDYILEDVDMVLLMTVNPGFGGQSFIPSMVAKIRDLAGMVKNRGKEILIEVDGGINAENAAAVCRAGAGVLVAGSAVFGSADRRAALQALRKAALQGARERPAASACPAYEKGDG